MELSTKNIRADFTGNSPVNKEIICKGFYHFVESDLAGKFGQDYITQCTATSFLGVCPVAEGVGFESDERNIRNWFARMLVKGISPVTLRRYLGKLHTFYVEYAGVGDAAEALFEELRGYADDKSLRGTDEVTELLQSVKSLPGKVGKLPEDEALYAKILLYMIYTGSAAYSDIENLKFSDPLPDIDQARELVASMPTERRTYVFPVGQGKNRSASLRQKLNSALSKFVSSIHSGSLHSFSQETIGAIWIAAALERGICFEAIASAVSHIPEGYKWLSVVKPLKPDDNRKWKILKSVADHILPTASRWYAMFMRKDNTPEKIKERIDEKIPEFSKDLTLFYPTRKIRKRVGKKNIFTQVPYIPNILFFKTRPDRVVRIFSEIGDMAWCLKTSTAPGASYAVISTKEMDDFQNFTGTHDNSITVEVVHSEEFVPDRRVRITGGIFKGKEGTIYKQKGKPQQDDIRIFLLNLTDGQKVKWQVSIEECYLEPLLP